jgi:hypothetical protein
MGAARPVTPNAIALGEEVFGRIEARIAEAKVG